MTDNSLDRAPETVVYPADLRRCAMCKAEKSESEFYRNPKTGRFKSYCRPCHRKWDNARYGQRREYLLAWHKKKRLEDPESYRKHRQEVRAKNREGERAYGRERYKSDPARFRAIAKAWREKNKARLKASWFKRKFGITIDQYQQMVMAQGGVCAICRRPESLTRDGVPQRLSVDHDHACCIGDRSCGKCIRGALCALCNAMLGHAKDDIDRLVSAAEYLRKWRR